MSDDETNSRLNSFDKEPATGNSTPNPNTDVTEHADLHHRLEPEPSGEPHTASEPHWKPESQASPVVVSSIPYAQPGPVPQPAGEVAALPNPGPGIMVLQWLTYAFWGWTVLALSGLVALVVNQLVKTDEDDYSLWDVSSGISYLLAAVIVLFIISLITDAFYAKAERTHARSNGTNVIMIIHAVIFALCGIGALISSVFGGVSLAIGEGGSQSGAVATIITGGIVFVTYGMTLLRTLRPRFVKGVAAIYWTFMAVAVLVGVIAGVAGPAAQQRLRNADEVIEQGLPTVADGINRYTTENGKLPTSLKDVQMLDLSGSSEDREKLLSNIRYTPGEKIANETSTDIQFGTDDLNGSQRGGANPVIYHYTLCVDYKTKRGTDSYDSSSSYYGRNNGQRYDTNIDTYSHPAGEKCYDVQTDYSY